MFAFGVRETTTTTGNLAVAADSGYPRISDAFREFECGNDNDLTFIRRGATELHFTNVKLYGLSQP